MWKTVVDDPRYEVSDKGEIRNRATKRMCKPYVRKNGYAHYTWAKGTVMIHRMVAKAFIPNPDGLPQVNHKNFNKSDNRVENLEWCTAQYNTQHAHKGGRCLQTHKWNMRPVVMLNDDGMEINRFDAIKDAAAFLGVEHHRAVANIMRAAKNDQRGYGYKWKYAE